MRTALLLVAFLLTSPACEGGNDEGDCPALARATVTGTITSPAGEAITPDRIELIAVEAPMVREECGAGGQVGAFLCWSGAGTASILQIELDGEAWQWPIESELTGSECPLPNTVALDIVLPPEE